MALKEELEAQGNWLFGLRSYLPLVMLPILIAALRDSGSLAQTLGDTGWQFYQGICIAVSLVGLTIRCITVAYVPDGTSGRNTKNQRAEKLNTTGMYSVVRHPLYLGNFIISLGMALFVQVWWFVLITILVFWLYYERIMLKEEEFLRKKFGNAYLDWAGRTPTFLPKFRNWRQPELPFSFRNVLRREPAGFFGIIASFTLMKTIQSLLGDGDIGLNPVRTALFLAGLVIFVTLRLLRKKTKILDVQKA